MSVDRTQMVRIITNLIKNAIEACYEIKKPLIEAEILKNKNSVVLLVKDNGAGMTKELKAKIFEPKFTTKTSGMGLGLGMVKNIVNSYKGTITLKSELGLGTTFKIKFPLLN